jgi:DNA-binding HxlR family transcriptional regulator
MASSGDPLHATETAGGVRSPTGDAGSSSGESHHTRVLAGDEVSSFLELLEDQYTQRILSALSDGPQAARELVDRSDASRSTVYRRLNALQRHGLVVTDMELHKDGHHRKRFEATLVRATIELVDGAPQVRLTLTRPVGADDSNRDPPAGD